MSQPEDPAEREAERAADALAQPPGFLRVPVFPPAQAALQRKCAQCRDEDEETVQRAAAGGVPSASFLSLQSFPPLRGAGTPLEGELRRYYEPRLGLDLGAVRIHTGAAADASARAVNALAYTLGQDLVFAAGRYQPGTAEGRHLLAHELVHVAQQARAPQAGAALQRQPADGAAPQGEADLEAYVTQILPEANGVVQDCVSISQYNVRDGGTVSSDSSCPPYVAPFCLPARASQEGTSLDESEEAEPLSDRSANVTLSISFFHHLYRRKAPPAGTPAPFKMRVVVRKHNARGKVVSVVRHRDDAPTYTGGNALKVSFPEDITFRMTRGGRLRARVHMEHPHGKLFTGLSLPVQVPPCS